MEYVRIVKVYWDWDCHSVREDLLEGRCEIFLAQVEGFLRKAVEKRSHSPASTAFILYKITTGLRLPWWLPWALPNNALAS